MNSPEPIEYLPDGSFRILHDWYPGVFPANISSGDMVYFDTSYSFTSFNSIQQDSFKIGYASGNYGRSNFVTGINGKIKIGQFTVLEACTIIANNSVSIGDNCMFSWGSVITDSWLDNETYEIEIRRNILKEASQSKNRNFNHTTSSSVIIENNVWVGFGAIILPGVRLGQGCVVAAKTIISSDVPPYAVVAGSPARIIKFLTPDDTEEVKQTAIDHFKNNFSATTHGQ
jgi:acetyltransferase-like isoleucine patch superfamily enzyme